MFPAAYFLSAIAAVAVQMMRTEQKTGRQAQILRQEVQIIHAGEAPAFFPMIPGCRRNAQFDSGVLNRNIVLLTPRTQTPGEQYADGRQNLGSG